MVAGCGQKKSSVASPAILTVLPAILTVLSAIFATGSYYIPFEACYLLLDDRWAPRSSEASHSMKCMMLVLPHRDSGAIIANRRRII